MLNQLDGRLIVSTYQHHQVFTLYGRRDGLHGAVSQWLKPMGIAADSDQLAIAAHKSVIWDGTEWPTGVCDIHEIAFADDGELWMAVTGYSCLATLEEPRWTPRWTPPWITSVEPEDRCHLNGLAMMGGRPAFVTCLGESDRPEGWRQDRLTGGVVVHVDTGTIYSGFCMPHSPRVHQDRLWLLESGRGALVALDPDTGARETVMMLPGFGRGLAFVGDLAFVGLSGVREEQFSDLPLVRGPVPLRPGVAVVDVRRRRVLAVHDLAVDEISDLQFCPYD